MTKKETVELKIFYLHYNAKNAPPKDRPDWFSFENCLKSLLVSIADLHAIVPIKLYLIFDGSVEWFQDDFSSKYFEHNEVIYADGVQKEVRFISAGVGAEASRQLLDLIFTDFKHCDDDLIYILENDYLHVSGWVKRLLAVIQAKIPFDYLSLYDHADKYQFTDSYNGKYDSLRSKLYFCNGMYWRSTPSTCFSFISRAKTLRADKIFFKKLKDRLIQPFLNLTRGRILISALPGLSTHCMSRYLSPGVAWREISAKAEEYQVNS